MVGIVPAHESQFENYKNLFFIKKFVYLYYNNSK